MLSFPALTSQTFSVLSLLPLTSSLLSADHATWYTEATWPRREVRYLEGGRTNSQKSASAAPPCGALLHCINVQLKGMGQPYFPVRPSQILIDLSNEADAMSLVSGEKRTSLTSALWPVILARGFLSSAGFHRNMVKSSEPDTKRSGAEPCGVTKEVRMVVREIWPCVEHTVLTLTLLYLCKAFSFTSSTVNERNGHTRAFPCKYLNRCFDSRPRLLHDPVMSWGLTVAVAGSKAPVRRT